MQRVRILCTKLTENMDNSSDQSQIIKMFQLTRSGPNQEVMHMPVSQISRVVRDNQHFS
jgi:hypothetical protein